MTYEQQYIKEWLEARPLLNIAMLEKVSGMPKDTLRHFLKDRKSLPEKHLLNIKEELKIYGFSELNDE